MQPARRTSIQAPRIRDFSGKSLKSSNRSVLLLSRLWPFVGVVEVIYCTRTHVQFFGVDGAVIVTVDIDVDGAVIVTVDIDTDTARKATT